MKKIPLLLLTFVLFLSSCSFNPPKGWTRNHHSYKEVLEYAKTLDPDATVTKGYTDSSDEYNRRYREWDAVIRGVDCHVASVSSKVWNDGFAAGEFTKTYYRMDTDHDHAVLIKILSENYSNWIPETDDISDRYNIYNILSSEYDLSEYRMLNDDELENVWQEALEIKTKFEKYAINKIISFEIPSPGKHYNHHGEGEYFVKKNSATYFNDFTDEGKRNFFEDYRNEWALLESGLPIYDE